MKTDFRIVVLFLFIILASCTSSHTINSVEPVIDVNKTITVTAPTQINTFKLNDFIRIAVQNNSDHEVLLSPENTIEITRMSEGQSTNVSNSLNSSNSEILLSPQSQKDTNQTLFAVIPDIKVQGAVTVRITVRGIDQTTNQEISGFIDLTLTP